MKYNLQYFAVAGFASIGLAFLSGTPLRAEYFTDTDCFTTDSINADTSITFYGDSRGDWVDLSSYGEFSNGWATYLDFGAERNWNIQNLAVAGQRAVDLFWTIASCNADSEQEAYKQYKTATRYAVEIGGNDYIESGLVVYIMPWKFGDAVRHVQQNQRLTLEIMKLALEKRGVPKEQAGEHILFMGNFPAVSRTHVSGAPKAQCFDGPLFFLNTCFPSLAEIFGGVRPGDPTYIERVREKANAAGRDFDIGMTDRWDAVVHGRSPSPYEAWQAWMTDGNSMFTLVSMLIMAGQPGERALAEQAGVHYLDLYPVFVRRRDCLAGECWNVEGALMRDPVHPSWLGYYFWGRELGGWLAANNWDQPWTPPEPPEPAPITTGEVENLCGAPNNPPCPTTGAPPTNDTDLLILCFLAGVCG